jgi:histidine phosphotransferase ChpT
VKLLLNMLVIAGQTIPRGGVVTVDPIGSGDDLAFKVTTTGLNAKIPQAIPPLLAGGTHEGGVDAHAIQPYYTGLLARHCGLSIGIAPDGESVVITAQ